MKLNRNISLVLSLVIVAGCTPGPIGGLDPSPSPAVTPTTAPVTPAPGTVPAPAPAPGVTTLTGTITFAPATGNATDWIVEVETVDGAFRKAIAASNNTFRISDVPTGKQVRLQAQYKNNLKVILSSRANLSTNGNGIDTSLNIDVQSTAIDMIYKRAQELGKTGVVAAVPDLFKTNEQLKTAVSTLQQDIQTQLSPGLDNVTQTLPTSSDLIKKIDGLMPNIEVAITGSSTPVTTPSTSPSSTPVAPGATPAPTPAPVSNNFTPVELVIQPSGRAKIAKDTVVRFFVEAKDANGQIQVVQPIWTSNSNSVAGTMDSSGKFTPRTQGNVLYRATYNNLSADVAIEVTDGELSGIKIVPDQETITLDAGKRFNLKAEGSDSLGNTNLLVTPTWILDDAAIGTVDGNGVFVGLRQGKTDVTAEVRNTDDDKYEDSFTLDILPGSPTNVNVEPLNPTVLVGKTQNFKLYASDIASNVSTGVFSFSVDDRSIGEIDNSGNFRAIKAGTTNIKISSTSSVGVVKTIPITVANDSPYISTISKTIVIPGETITLTGENFSNVASENKVTFDGISANVISASSTSLSVIVPAGAITGFAEITTNGKKGSGIFYIVEPIVSDVTPNNADVGDLVTITGSHFDTAHPIRNIVTFGTIQASTPVSVQSNLLQVILPSGATGQNDVRVLVRNQSSNFKQFRASGSTVSGDDIDWETREKMLTQRAYLNFRQIDNDLYAIGGDNSNTSRRLEKYDVNDNDWETKESLPSSRTRFGTAVVNSELYAIGGDSNSKTVERYNPSNNSWTTRASMLVGRSRMVVEAVNGKIYVIGGIGDSNAGVTVEEFNPGSNVWTTKSNAPASIFDAASTVHNGKIYIIGGGSSGSKKVYAYNPDNNSWESNLTDLPSDRKNSACVTVNGRIYVIGGFDNSGNEVSNVYEFNPSTTSGSNTGTWSSVDTLPEIRAAGAAAERSGRIYFVGGLDSGGSLKDTVYRGTFK